MNYQRITVTLLALLTVFAIGAVLRLTALVVLPLVIAILLSFVLNPIVTFIHRVGVPRPLSVVVVMAMVFGVVTLGFLLLYTSVQSLIRRFPGYQARLMQLIDELIETANLPPEMVSEMNLTGNLSAMVLELSGSVVEAVGSLLMVLVFLLFMLLEKPYMRGKMVEAVQVPRTDRIVRVLTSVSQQIAGYLSVKLLVSSLTAVIVYINFSIIGVDFAIIWALLALLFNFIPSIGSIIVTVLSGLFALLQFAPEWNLVIATVGSMALTQFLIGNILDPKLLGDRLNLSPIVILFSLLLWGWVWGTVGMFLAVPITVAIKITLESVPGLEWLGILMGTGNYRERGEKGKWYQRVYGIKGVRVSEATRQDGGPASAEAMRQEAGPEEERFQAGDGTVPNRAGVHDGGRHARTRTRAPGDLD